MADAWPIMSCISLDPHSNSPVNYNKSKQLPVLCINLSLLVG